MWIALCIHKLFSYTTSRLNNFCGIKNRGKRSVHVCLLMKIKNILMTILYLKYHRWWRYAFVFTFVAGKMMQYLINNSVIYSICYHDSCSIDCSYKPFKSSLYEVRSAIKHDKGHMYLTNILLII